MTHRGLRRLANLGPSTRRHKVTGLGWLDSLLRLCPWASGDPSLLGAGRDSWTPSLPSSPWPLLRPDSSSSRASLSHLTPKQSLWSNFYKSQASAAVAQSMGPRHLSPGSNPASGVTSVFSTLNWGHHHLSLQVVMENTGSRGLQLRDASQRHQRHVPGVSLMGI